VALTGGVWKAGGGGMADRSAVISVSIFPELCMSKPSSPD
jgi:hypothetical protein